MQSCSKDTLYLRRLSDGLRREEFSSQIFEQLNQEKFQLAVVTEKSVLDDVNDTQAEVSLAQLWLLCWGSESGGSEEAENAHHSLFFAAYLSIKNNPGDESISESVWNVLNSIVSIGLRNEQKIPINQLDNLTQFLAISSSKSIRSGQRLSTLLSLLDVNETKSEDVRSSVIKAINQVLIIEKYWGGLIYFVCYMSRCYHLNFTDGIEKSFIRYIVRKFTRLVDRGPGCTLEELELFMAAIIHLLDGAIVSLEDSQSLLNDTARVLAHHVSGSLKIRLDALQLLIDNVHAFYNNCNRLDKEFVDAVNSLIIISSNKPGGLGRRVDCQAEARRLLVQLVELAQRDRIHRDNTEDSKADVRDYILKSFLKSFDDVNIKGICSYATMLMASVGSTGQLNGHPEYIRVLPNVLRVMQYMCANDIRWKEERAQSLIPCLLFVACSLASNPDVDLRSVKKLFESIVMSSISTCVREKIGDPKHLVLAVKGIVDNYLSLREQLKWEAFFKLLMNCDMENVEYCVSAWINVIQTSGDTDYSYMFKILLHQFRFGWRIAEGGVSHRAAVVSFVRHLLEFSSANAIGLEKSDDLEGFIMVALEEYFKVINRQLNEEYLFVQIGRLIGTTCDSYSDELKQKLLKALATYMSTYPRRPESLEFVRLLSTLLLVAPDDVFSDVLQWRNVAKALLSVDDVSCWNNVYKVLDRAHTNMLILQDAEPYIMDFLQRDYWRAAYSSDMSKNEYEERVVMRNKVLQVLAKMRETRPESTITIAIGKMPKTSYVPTLVMVSVCDKVFMLVPNILDNLDNVEIILQSYLHYILVYQHAFELSEFSNVVCNCLLRDASRDREKRERIVTDAVQEVIFSSKHKKKELTPILEDVLQLFYHNHLSRSSLIRLFGKFLLRDKCILEPVSHYERMTELTRWFLHYLTRLIPLTVESVDESSTSSLELYDCVVYNLAPLIQLLPESVVDQFKYPFLVRRKSFHKVWISNIKAEHLHFTRFHVANLRRENDRSPKKQYDWLNAIEKVPPGSTRYWSRVITAVGSEWVCSDEQLKEYLTNLPLNVLDREICAPQAFYTFADVYLRRWAAIWAKDRSNSLSTLLSLLSQLAKCGPGNASSQALCLITGNDLGFLVEEYNETASTNNRMLIVLIVQIMLSDCAAKSEELYEWLNFVDRTILVEKERMKQAEYSDEDERLMKALIVALLSFNHFEAAAKVVVFIDVPSGLQPEAERCNRLKRRIRSMVTVWITRVSPPICYDFLDFLWQRVVTPSLSSACDLELFELLLLPCLNKLTGHHQAYQAALLCRVAEYSKKFCDLVSVEKLDMNTLNVEYIWVTSLDALLRKTAPRVITSLINIPDGTAMQCNKMVDPEFPYGSWQGWKASLVKRCRANLSKQPGGEEQLREKLHLPAYSLLLTIVSLWPQKASSLDVALPSTSLAWSSILPKDSWNVGVFKQAFDNSMDLTSVDADFIADGANLEHEVHVTNVYSELMSRIVRLITRNIPEEEDKSGVQTSGQPKWIANMIEVLKFQSPSQKHEQLNAQLFILSILSHLPSTGGHQLWSDDLVHAVIKCCNNLMTARDCFVKRPTSTPGIPYAVLAVLRGMLGWSYTDFKMEFLCSAMELLQKCASTCRNKKSAQALLTDIRSMIDNEKAVNEPSKNMVEMEVDGVVVNGRRLGYSPDGYKLYPAARRVNWTTTLDKWRTDVKVTVTTALKEWKKQAVIFKTRRTKLPLQKPRPLYMTDTPLDSQGTLRDGTMIVEEDESDEEEEEESHVTKYATKDDRKHRSKEEWNDGHMVDMLLNAVLQGENELSMLVSISIGCSRIGERIVLDYLMSTEKIHSFDKQVLREPLIEVCEEHLIAQELAIPRRFSNAVYDELRDPKAKIKLLRKFYDYVSVEEDSDISYIEEQCSTLAAAASPIKEGAYNTAVCCVFHFDCVCDLFPKWFMFELRAIDAVGSFVRKILEGEEWTTCEVGEQDESRNRKAIYSSVAVLPVTILTHLSKTRLEDALNALDEFAAQMCDYYSSYLPITKWGIKWSDAIDFYSDISNIMLIIGDGDVMRIRHWNVESFTAFRAAYVIVIIRILKNICPNLELEVDSDALMKRLNEKCFGGTYYRDCPHNEYDRERHCQATSGMFGFGRNDWYDDDDHEDSYKPFANKIRDSP